MLDIKLIRDNPAFVKERLAHKQFKQVEMVDQISTLDAERRQLQQELDSVLNQSNLAAKAIGGLMKEGKREEADAKKAEVAQLKEQEKSLKEKLTAVETAQQDLAIQLPNLPAAAVPAGTGPD
ncbi:MAG: serine--tRNA ligase, partial [Chitinophagaceae bacterium]|nr:serine--tRNA ligase [Chitinophagaceae bacterium]